MTRDEAMDCKQALELVEPIAGGDVLVTEDMRAHFESCPRCAAALASARRVEALLETRDAPAPPARFTPVVLQRIRRERWSAEQHVDRLFNAAMVLASLVIVGGVAALLNVSGMLAAAGALWAAISVAGESVAREVGAAAVTYVAAGGLLLSALAMWWWAERRLSL